MHMKKQFILSTMIMLVAVTAIAQVDSRQSTNYEAANWKTWLLDNPQEITVPAPPNSAQSKAELQLLKQRISKVDAQKMKEIKYWDAGAPSYRWNQIIPSFLSLKQSVMF